MTEVGLLRGALLKELLGLIEVALTQGSTCTSTVVLAPPLQARLLSFGLVRFLLLYYTHPVLKPEHAVSVAILLRVNDAYLHLPLNCARQEDNISGNSDAPSAFVLAALVQSAPLAYTQCTVQGYNSALKM